MTIERQDTYDTVLQIVTEKLKKDKDAIIKAQTFQDLGVDSIDMVEMVMKLEEQFNIEINDEDAEKLITVDQVVDYIHALREK